VLHIVDLSFTLCFKSLRNVSFGDEEVV
jgi:hypothetical protein